MKKIIISMCALFVLALAGSVQASSVFFDDFNDGTADGWWVGYSQHTTWKDGNWRVESLESPHDGVLVQDNSGDHFIALVNDIESSSQIIETQLILNGFGSYGGVTIWFQDDNNWVNILLYPAAGFVNVYENENGTKTSHYYYHATTRDNWYNLKVDANSETGELDVYLDDMYLFTHNSSVFNRSGLSGVNNGNAGAYFDNFELTIIPDVPTSKKDCKKGNWKDWTEPKFKNQGQCISYVQKNSKASKIK